MAHGISNLLGLAKGPKARTPEEDSELAAAEKKGLDTTPVRLLRGRIIAMALLVSMGGIVFGYDTGQISGFLEMEDFLKSFGTYNGTGPPDEGSSYAFSNVRSGLIVGLLSIGTLAGVLANGWAADILGRRRAIVLWCLVFSVGLIVQISSNTNWVQIAVGRVVAGFGVGGLSVMTPLYQSEVAPRHIRGALVCCYQLFITFGIFLADAINLGTYKIRSHASWQITIGIGWLFPLIMGVGIMFLRESPRWDYRQGKIDEARKTIALSYGVPENHVEVVREFTEIKEKYEAETSGGLAHPWYEIFTGPRMAYRTLLGVSLQILQQLTGANFFFYFGTTVFNGVGIENSYITSLILGVINFGSTFFGLYVVETFGRRKALMTGGIFMTIFFLIFASVGQFVLLPNQGSAASPPTPEMMNTAHTAGVVMIVFTSLFIFSYATTWGPTIWSIIPELYPSRYRSKSMGLATSGNWTFNFLLAFFTSFITSDINYAYGYVFAGCNLAGVFVVFFFLCESQGRTLEEIDTMYIMRVPPWRSASWKPPVGEQLGETDRAYLTPGARGIAKPEQRRGEERVETLDEAKYKS